MFRLFRPALAFAAIAGLVVAGCGGSSGTPTPPPISDPDEIIVRSIEASQDIKSLHIRVNVNGIVDLSAFGEQTGGLKGKIDLSGTYAEGDVDVATKSSSAVKADVAFGAPGAFGLAGRVIVVDGYMYTKVSLLGDKYTKTKLDDTLPVDLPSVEPSASFDITKQLEELRESLKDAGATTTLKDTEKVDGKDCYRIEIDIPEDKLNDVIGEAAGGATEGMTVESLKIDYYVYMENLRPAKLTVKADIAKVGELTLELVITKYDQSVNIKAPDASQIQEEPEV